MTKTNRELVFRVTIHDCEVQTFRVGGHGGQRKDKKDIGVRVIHHPSGARGESREHRSQFDNKKTAFVRMAKSKEYQTWAKIKALSLPSIDAVVEDWMQPENLVIEMRKDNKWVEYEDDNA